MEMELQSWPTALNPKPASAQQSNPSSPRFVGSPAPTGNTIVSSTRSKGKAREDHPGRSEPASEKTTPPKWYAFRMFGKGKAQADEADDEDSVPPTEPSPHTRPLLAKPSPRNETFLEYLDRSKPQVKKPTEAWSFDINKWGTYLKYYSEGRFNVSNPPVPPHLGEFQFLRAPIPPNEEGRTKFAKQIGTLYSGPAISRADQLVILARRMLLTRHASLSFIHGVEEVLKVQYGYQRGQETIARSDSLAAHCVFSTEPLIILDTHKDWRFQRNPLVLRHPKIRFFAGAPLVTSDGTIIGVFAVFDPVFRVSFPYGGQRALVDFAKIAMTDIELLLENTRVEKTNHAKAAADKLFAMMYEEMTFIEGLRNESRLPTSPVADRTEKRELPDQNGSANDREGDRTDNDERPSSPSSSQAVFNFDCGPYSDSASPNEDGTGNDHAESSTASNEEAVRKGRRNRNLSTVLETLPNSRPFSFPSKEAQTDLSSDPAAVEQSSSDDVTDLLTDLFADSCGSNQQDDNTAPTSASCSSRKAEKSPAEPHRSLSLIDPTLKEIAEKLRYNIMYVLRVRTSSGLETKSSQATSMRALGSYGLESRREFWAPFHLSCLRLNSVVTRHNPDWDPNDNTQWRQSILIPLAQFRISSNSTHEREGLTDTETYHQLKESKAAVAGVVLAAFVGQARDGVDANDQDIRDLLVEAHALKRLVKNVVLGKESDLTDIPISFSSGTVEIQAGPSPAAAAEEARERYV
ncbi:MAG: hypothetical protein M1837_003072 [Sclerophora amabilis]|nr:MAG: hypothetical protein M1837_003072 [Sclerophora amabilis]